MSDKRFTPEFSAQVWATKGSERDWHYCKYCYKDTPSFVLTEGRMGSLDPVQKLRCCWECGSGIEILYFVGDEK